MKWRCVNDWFGYCSGEPDGAANARTEERSTKVNGVDTIVKINTGMGATCSLNPKTCGKRQSFETVCPPSEPQWKEPEELIKLATTPMPEPETPIMNKCSKKSKSKEQPTLL